jgi:hypothetical protein
MSLRILTISLSLLVFILAACSEGPPTVGEAKAFTTACDKANDGQRIAVEGYLRLPDSFTGEQSVVLRLYEAADLGGSPIGVQTRFGSEANQVEIVPDQYSDDDLNVHLADGQLAKFGTKVKVSGKVYYPLVGQDFDCGLENPLIELAK